MVVQPPRPARFEPNRRVALTTTLAALHRASGAGARRIRRDYRPNSPRICAAAQCGGEAVLRPALGLFGKDAPVATAQFKALCAGTLAVPCEPEPTFDAMTMERLRARLSPVEAVRRPQAEPATYDGSQIWRVIQGRRVDAGAVRGKYALRDLPPTPPSERRAQALRGRLALGAPRPAPSTLGSRRAPTPPRTPTTSSSAAWSTGWYARAGRLARRQGRGDDGAERPRRGLAREVVRVRKHGSVLLAAQALKKVTPARAAVL